MAAGGAGAGGPALETGETRLQGRMFHARAARRLGFCIFAGCSLHHHLHFHHLPGLSNRQQVSFDLLAIDSHRFHAALDSTGICDIDLVVCAAGFAGIAKIFPARYHRIDPQAVELGPDSEDILLSGQGEPASAAGEPAVARPAG